MKKIESGLELGRYLDNVISETMKQALYNKALEEKDKQHGDEETNFDSMQSKTGQDDGGEGAVAEVSLDAVVDRLNSIRSGKSFKDSLIQQRFEEYFKSLSEAERAAMFSFLKGIAQIVTGDLDAKQADEPSKDNVTMHKGPDMQRKKVDPNVIKKPSPPENDKPKVDKGSGDEDTRAPIQVKKRG
jgi:hypothetical protein